MAKEQGRESIISIRLSEREEKQLKAAASKRGAAISTFVRDAALQVARPAHTVTWSTTPSTIVAAGTIIPRFDDGTVVVPAPAFTKTEGTAGNLAEPITRSR